MREPITFITYCYNDRDRIEGLLTTMRPALGDRGEILVVDQGSTDGSLEVLDELADHVLHRRRKGFPDPDRNFAASMAGNDWIFTLDADELPDGKLLARLGQMADTSHGVMVYWLRRKNLVDGMDIFPILKEDWQPRFFRKGALNYGPRMHTHPEIGTPRQMWVDTGCIVHERTRKDIERAHASRALVGDREKQGLEGQFMQRLVAFLETGDAGEGADATV
jgi:glycosyltransferase involved in cell wall biosynthesis